MMNGFGYDNPLNLQRDMVFVKRGPWISVKIWDNLRNTVTQHIKHHCIAVQMFSYACKVITFAFVATYAVNLVANSLFKTFLRFRTVAEEAQLTLTHSQANMIELDNNLNPINLYRNFPICLWMENPIWDGCRTAESLVWCQPPKWFSGPEGFLEVRAFFLEEGGHNSFWNHRFSLEF